MSPRLFEKARAYFVRLMGASIRRLALLQLLSALVAINMPTILLGQMENPTTQAGTSSFGSYQPNGIDTINLENGSVSVDIPLLSYPQRGTKLHLSFSARYAPASWEFNLTATNTTNDGITHYHGYWGFPGYGDGETNPTQLGAYVARDQAISEVVSELDFPCSGTVPNQNPCDNTLPPGGPPPPLTVDLMSILTSDGGVHTIAEWEPTYGTGAILISTMDGTNFAPVGGPSGYGLAVNEILGPDGVTYTPASYTPSTGYIVAFNQSDPEGNSISVSTNGWTDTLGRLIPGSTYGPGTGLSAPGAIPPGGDPFPGVTASSAQGCTNGATSARVWNVPAWGGQTATYILCYSNVNATSPSFPTAYLSGNEELDSSSISASESLLTQVVLPGNTGSYTFAYNPDLTLSSITLPTGGMISYTYQTLTWYTGQGLVVDLIHAFSRAIATRTVTNTDGSQNTWNYAFSPTGIQGDANVIVTDPAGNQVVHTESGGGDTAQYYQGSQSTGTLLKTEAITRNVSYSLPFRYPGGSENNYDPGITGPILSVQTTLPNGKTSLVQNNLVTGTTPAVCHSVYNDKQPPYYENPFEGQCGGPLPQIQSVNEYAYGQGSPGALVKTTTTNYQWQASTAYANANMIDLPQSVVVTDGSGNTVSSTTYGYDENNGNPQGVYGNLTSTTITGQNGAYTKTSTVYNTQGMPVTTYDGNLNPTTYIYGDSSVASPTSTCLPTTGNGATHCFLYTWDTNTGKMNSSKDPNNVLTQYSYDSLGRVTAIDAAVGTLSASDTIYSYPTPNVATTSADEQTLGDGKLKSSVTVDGFGRQIQTTDPAGATVDTTYDNVGNVASTSNPYFSTSDTTYGVTSYLSDALGRKTYQCQQDNSSSPTTTCTPSKSYQQWQYNSDTVTFTDETGKQWARTFDALDRLIKVIEDASGAKLETDYQYNALDDLLSVMQCGGACPSSSAVDRIFTYDGLGHLLAATNPESGTVGYNYDANGNVLSKTSPAPNSASGSITTSYTYDALNRLLSKSSNDAAATPTACYQYDQSSQAQSPAYMIGRLANDWTQSANGGSCAPTMPTGSGTTLLTSKSILAYDPMGRAINEQTCVYPACTTTLAQYPMSYTYDLAGHTTSYTNGVNSSENNSFLFTNQYDSAGRLSQITSSPPGSTYPSSLFSYPTYNSAGGLTGATYGTGTGVTVCRWYDVRLRVTGEVDTGGATQNGTPCPMEQPQ